MSFFTRICSRGSTQGFPLVSLQSSAWLKTDIPAIDSFLFFFPRSDFLFRRSASFFLPFRGLLSPARIFPPRARQSTFLPRRPLFFLSHWSFLPFCGLFSSCNLIFFPTFTCSLSLEVSPPLRSPSLSFRWFQCPDFIPQIFPLLRQPNSFFVKDFLVFPLFFLSIPFFHQSTGR